MASSTVACPAVSELAALLDSPQIQVLIADLDETRWTGRPGYPIRSMIGMTLAKTIYSISTWTKIVSLVNEHEALSKVISPNGDIPSVFACYRFTKKLKENDHLLEKSIKNTISSLNKKNPEFGKNISIDASDIPAYANGQRFVSKGGREREKYSDPDASWGHRSAVSTRKGGGFYGYRLHMAVCSKTDLPLAWQVKSGSVNETESVSPLLNKIIDLGISPDTCALDKGYDSNRIYEDLSERNIAPIIPLKKTEGVKKGWDQPPACEHGEWQFAGADYKRKATKWRCPTGECGTKSKWVSANRLHTLIPRSTDRWKKLYRGRASVERAFGRLKHEWAMLPLRVRGIAKVKLHVDLTILTKLSCALLRV
jgi:IS5 family transposase